MKLILAPKWLQDHSVVSYLLAFEGLCRPCILVCISIPHICHGRHGRRPCKFFLPGVNFYRFNAKNWRQIWGMCVKSLRLSPMLLTSSSVRPSTYGTIVLLCLLKTWESRLSRSIKSAFGLKKKLIENVQGSLLKHFGKYRSVAFFQLWWALGNFCPNSADSGKESTT